MEEKMVQRIERQFAGRALTVETGRMARQAAGSCVIQYGETVMLIAATVQENPTHLPFFPLTVPVRVHAGAEILDLMLRMDDLLAGTEVLTAAAVDSVILDPEDLLLGAGLTFASNSSRNSVSAEWIGAYADGPTKQIVVILYGNGTASRPSRSLDAWGISPGQIDSPTWRIVSRSASVPYPSTMRCTSR